MNPTTAVDRWFSAGDADRDQPVCKGLVKLLGTGHGAGMHRPMLCAIYPKFG